MTCRECIHGPVCRDRKADGGMLCSHYICAADMFDIGTIRGVLRETEQDMRETAQTACLLVDKHQYLCRATGVRFARMKFDELWHKK